MQIGNIVICDVCGEEIVIDSFDLEDGEAFCLECGELTKIEKLN